MGKVHGRRELTARSLRDHLSGSRPRGCNELLKYFFNIGMEKLISKLTFCLILPGLLDLI
jgi:hypothetical protein